MIDDTFVQKILDINKVQKIEVGDREYFDRTLIPVKDPEPTAIQVQTLTGLVDYLKAYPDGSIAEGGYLIHIETENIVSLTQGLIGNFLQRPVFLMAAFSGPQLPFGQYMDLETFLTALQRLFEATEAQKTLCSLFGHITDGAVSTSDDDGITQNVTVKAGASIRDDAKVQNPARLKPYRTFPEIDQPESPFIVRLRSGSNSGEGRPTVALFEADGGAWKNEAILKIKQWLEDAGVDAPILA